MQLCESIEPGLVDGDPNANTRSPFSPPEDGWRCEMHGNASLSAEKSPSENVCAT